MPNTLFSRGDEVTLRCLCQYSDGGKIGYTPEETIWSVYHINPPPNEYFRIRINGGTRSHIHEAQCLTLVTPKELPEGIEGFE